MNFFVYILKNKSTGRYYIGTTNNKERRLEEHNRGQNTSTKSSGEWEIIYFETFKSGREAKKRERKIKSYKSGNAFKKLIGKTER